MATFGWGRLPWLLKNDVTAEKMDLRKCPPVSPRRRSSAIMMATSNYLLIVSIEPRPALSTLNTSVYPVPMVHKERTERGTGCTFKSLVERQSSFPAPAHALWPDCFQCHSEQNHDDFAAILRPLNALPCESSLTRSNNISEVTSYITLVFVGGLTCKEGTQGHISKLEQGAVEVMWLSTCLSCRQPEFYLRIDTYTYSHLNTHTHTQKQWHVAHACNPSSEGRDVKVSGLSL